MWNTVCMTTQNDRPVLVSVRKTTGVLELNRPGALNALNPEMIGIISDALEQWRDDGGVTQVLIVSGAAKGFCAGGDVRYTREWILAGGDGAIDDFFRTEYAMNHVIATFPKPYVAVIDGVVMGGGLGVSAHGSHRIITDGALAAMPETMIGYLTDVGMSWLFQRLPRGSQALAAFLGVTGYRLSPADMVWSGLATHHISSLVRQAFVDTVIDRGVEAAVTEYDAAPVDASRLADLIDDIEATFGHDTWEQIDAALDAHDNREFVEQVRALMAQASPSSVVATVELVATNSRAECLQDGLDNEERLGEVLRRRPDFVEGVRAVLVDKSRDAVFDPAHTDQVDPAPYRAVLKG